MLTTESRAHPRIKCRVIVEKLGPTTDLSAGGLCVLTTNPLPAGSEVRLAFSLPDDGPPLQCHGRVVRVAPSTIDRELYEVGLQYQRMMSRDREALSAYVAGLADLDDRD
jgi:Tfp pilus assembly protein PilZ